MQSAAALHDPAPPVRRQQPAGGVRSWRRLEDALGVMWTVEAPDASASPLSDQKYAVQLENQTDPIHNPQRG